MEIDVNVVARRAVNRSQKEVCVMHFGEDDHNFSGDENRLAVEYGSFREKKSKSCSEKELLRNAIAALAFPKLRWPPLIKLQGKEIQVNRPAKRHTTPMNSVATINPAQIPE
ncbi:hypothetical protein CDAR_501111 [Caerostris darwini]|uniref:Uncharacterized protein n=1 Tax=Caerostris darwini TaxID=1538125 RepID=A0AAV4MXB9_9ARAC|nr:hypothetical protein CDAR_443061 [Caerostris darwini]GIX83217.1 hypothetical protein CDAR_501111 [Caerostris darwini]